MEYSITGTTKDGKKSPPPFHMMQNAPLQMFDRVLNMPLVMNMLEF